MFKSERITTTIIAIVIILIVGFVASRLVGYLAYQHWTKDLDEVTQKYQAQYAEQVKYETDSNKLVSRAEKYIKSDNIAYALITLKQATTIDPNYRDGWIWLGYIQLKNNDFSGALQALKTAEKIDPLYKETYELLIAAYNQLDDKEMAGKMEERVEFLGKNPKP